MPNEENRIITVTEALEITINLLNGISIPVALMEQIGVPISQAVSNLGECIRAMKENEARMNADAPADYPEACGRDVREYAESLPDGEVELQAVGGVQ